MNRTRIKRLCAFIALFGAIALPGTVAAADVTVHIEGVTRNHSLADLLAEVTVTCAEEQYVDVVFTLSQPRLTAKHQFPRSIAYTNFTVSGFCGPTPTTFIGGLDSFFEPFHPGIAWVTQYRLDVCEADFTGCETLHLADTTVRLAP
jgi:hypothetical protein